MTSVQAAQALAAPPAPAFEAMSLAEAGATWAELAGRAAATPYGSHQWISAFAAAEEGPVRVAVARDAAGAPTVLLALAIERRLGLKLGRPVGGKHANFSLPIVRRDVEARLDPASARALLRGAGRALGLDAVSMSHVPARWDGRASVFAAIGRPGPSPAWSLSLPADPEAALTRSMSGDARKKLRSKMRGLEKAMGPVRLVRAERPDEIDAFLDVFYGQKETRFRQLGIDDPFRAPGVRAAIRAGALPGAAPAIEIYGLQAGGTTVAVLGGAADATRLSGMFISFDGERAGRYSPGDLLVTEIIREQSRLGRTTFDLGVGDARYKRSICDTREELFEVAVPVTWRGHALTAALALRSDALRRIKANPRLFALANRVRRRLSGRDVEV